MVARIVPRAVNGGKIRSPLMLKRILAVDTTSAHGSMALLEDEELTGILGFRTVRPRHAENLLPSIEVLLAGVEKKIQDVDAFAVAIGPGSFSGLRVGIAAVEGLAYALDRPAVGVSTLDATAHRYRRRRGLIVALAGAYRGDVYGRCYASDGEHAHPACDPRCIAPERFLDELPKRPELIAGSAILTHRALLEARYPSGVTLEAPSLFIAEEVARLGAEMLARGERAPLGGLDALYIRPSDAQLNQKDTTT